MPNWCENTLTVSGQAADLAAFNEWLGDQPLTMERVKPMPKELEGTVPLDVAQRYVQAIEDQSRESYKWYLEMIESGIAREQARMILPVNLYTEWYWKQDLHNLMHLMALRCDHHAQYEIQVYGNAIAEIVQQLCPWTMEAWNKYHPMRNAVKLSQLEVDAIQKYNCEREIIALIGEINTDNKREQNEWKVKARKLGYEI